MTHHDVKLLVCDSNCPSVGTDVSSMYMCVRLDVYASWLFILQIFHLLLPFLFFFFPKCALLLLHGRGRKKKPGEDDESLSALQQQLHNYSSTGWTVCIERRDWFALMVCIEWWHVIGSPGHRCSVITTGTAERRRVVRRREIRFVCERKGRIRPRQDKGQRTNSTEPRKQTFTEK